MSVRDIMDQLAVNIEDALGTELAQVVARLNPEPTPPCVDIYPGDPFGSTEEAGFQTIVGAYVFTVRARVNTADHAEGQDTLLDMMDADSDVSVAAALQADQKLGGLASSVKVEGPTGFRNYIDEGGTRAYLGCEWSVTVLPETT